MQWGSLIIHASQCLRFVLQIVKHATYQMTSGLLCNFLDSVWIPILEKLLEVPPRLLPQEAPAGFGRDLFLVVDYLTYANVGIIDQGRGFVFGKFLLQYVPSDCPRRHFPSKVSRVVDQFKDGFRCVVTFSVSKFVNTGISTGTIVVALCKSSKNFRKQVLFEQESGDTRI